MIFEMSAFDVELMTVSLYHMSAGCNSEKM